MGKHKVFISYHHKNDQDYKEKLLWINRYDDIFIDASVDSGDINDSLSDDSIREIIRDDYLRDSTVTIVLVGIETKTRKHIDWEIYSSMYNGTVNKKSGVLIIMLPSTGCTYYTAAHANEKEYLYSDTINWKTITDRETYEKRYPYMPTRIIDNLLVNTVKISVVNWNKIEYNPEYLRFLIDVTYSDRSSCNYDLSRKMKRINS